MQSIKQPAVNRHIASWILMAVMAVCFMMTTIVSAAPSYQPVSITISGGEASQVLTMMAKMGKLSLVADSSVKGAVSISLKSVPLDIALDLVCKSNSWTWTRIGDTIVVTDSAKAAKDAALYGETEVIHLKYADPAEVSAKLPLVIPAERTKVDVRTNSVIITGSDVERAKVHQLIQSLDVPIPQVNVVARVEEISKDAMKRLGIQWDLDGKAITLGYEAGKLQVGLEYGTLLNALESTGDASSLANSSISTLDGQEANILAGEKIPVTKESVVDGKVVKTYEMVEVGVKLKILPKINVQDKTVTIKLTPEVSNSPSDISGMPRISTREASTIISLKDGETRALGGLFQKRDEIIIKKVPVLGYIPLIGALFTTKQKITKESEIIVFITPKIINSDVQQDLKSDLRSNSIIPASAKDTTTTKKSEASKAPAPVAKDAKAKAAVPATKPVQPSTPPPVVPVTTAETQPPAKVESAPVQQTTVVVPPSQPQVETKVTTQDMSQPIQQTPVTPIAKPVETTAAKEAPPVATADSKTTLAVTQTPTPAPSTPASEVPPVAEPKKREVTLVARVEKVKKAALTRNDLLLPSGRTTYDGITDGKTKQGLEVTKTVDLLNSIGDSKTLVSNELAAIDGAETTLTVPGEKDAKGQVIVNGGVLRLIPKVIGDSISIEVIATGYDASKGGKESKTSEKRTSVTFKSGDIKAVGGMYQVTGTPKKGFFAWLFGIKNKPDSDIVIFLTPTLK